MHQPPLSATKSGREWVTQFAPADRSNAAGLLDSMLLLNDDEVTGALLALLGDLAVRSAGSRDRISLYAEREIAGATLFNVEPIRDSGGRVRQRAIGRTGPPPVKPVRGSSRVGSEGMVAFVISQAVKSWPKVFLNHPGPDRFRGSRPVRCLAIVTDFIGSGTRVLKMLDSFWAIPTVRAWASRGWLTFKVVAAAGTREGVQNVRAHRQAPEVLVKHIAPTLHGSLQHPWRALAEAYGPEAAAGAGRLGFKDNGALIAFTYGIPNNAPLILHAAGPGWRPLFVGPAPSDARPAFGIRTPGERIARAAEATGVELRPQLHHDDASLIIFLCAIRGRWRATAVTPIAEMTGLTEPEILAAVQRAVQQGLMDVTGRLTDAGQLAIEAARPETRRPRVPTNQEPYYPWQLRAPWMPSSTSRSSERPR